MSLRVSHTTVNARDAHALSVFWAELLGYAEDPDDPNEPGHEECMIYSPDLRHRILFIEVDEVQEPGRIHFDLAPVEGSRDGELERVRALGATDVADRRTTDGRGWVVLADPEGNTFCVLRSDSERIAAGDPLAPSPREALTGGSIPILPMGDPVAAFAWWVRLGFEVEFEHRFGEGMPLYAGLRRGSSQVHLSQHRGDTHGPGTMYLWVDDVDTIAHTFGVSIDDNEWGRDCQLVDPAGNRVRVGATAETAAAETAAADTAAGAVPN